MSRIVRFGGSLAAHCHSLIAQVGSLRACRRVELRDLNIFRSELRRMPRPSAEKAGQGILTNTVRHFCIRSPEGVFDTGSTFQASDAIGCRKGCQHAMITRVEERTELCRWFGQLALRFWWHQPCNPFSYGTTRTTRTTRTNRTTRHRHVGATEGLWGAASRFFHFFSSRRVGQQPSLLQAETFPKPAKRSVRRARSRAEKQKSTE